MNISESELARAGVERGQILTALKQDYGREMTSVRSLWKALDLLGHPISASGLQYSLNLLNDEGYIRVWRASEFQRQDRVPDERGDVVIFCRVTPKGLRLIEGHEPANPSVVF